MSVGNYINYSWRTQHKDITVEGLDYRVLAKNDDGGALYRVKKTFSFEYPELLSRFYQENFEGILLEVNRKKNCNYAGYYFIDFETFVKESFKQPTSRVNPILKIHVPIDYWLKLDEIETNIYEESFDSDWANQLKSQLMSGRLTGLADKSDVERYNKELEAGIYNQVA
jgi:hypothetical protein